MTHIADCMRSDIGLGLNNLIAKGLYEGSSDQVHPVALMSTIQEPNSKKVFTDESPKYRIWPSTRHPSVGSIHDADKVSALLAGRPASATGHRSKSGNIKSRRASSNPPRLQSSISLSSQREIPASETGVMSTVQEGCMDSPTLPRSHLSLRPQPSLSLQGQKNNDSVSLVSKEALVKSSSIPDKESFVETLPQTTYSPSGSTPKRSVPADTSDSINVTSFLAPLELSDYDSFGHSFLLLGQSSDLEITDIPPPVPPKSPLPSRSRSPPKQKLPTFQPNGSTTTLVNSSRSPSPNASQECGQTTQVFGDFGSQISMGFRYANDRNPSFSKMKTHVQPPKRAASGYRQSAQIQSTARSTAMRSRFDKFEGETSITGAYEVLSSKGVSLLTQDLRDLDEQYDRFRMTHSSLRSSRRTLRGRLITYLRSPRITTFSRKSILKREEALAELEVAIDDVVLNLESIESRRVKIQQKLLEHISASLVLRQNQTLDQTGSDPTPPHSPDSPLCGLRKRSDLVETEEPSHDTTIEALLRDIETLVSSNAKICVR